MPCYEFVRRTTLVRTARSVQMEGLFDVASSTTSEVSWRADLPIDDKPWHVGLIVGPSGSGKSQLAREMFGANVIERYDWPIDKSVLDGFPADASIRDITEALSSVGFSSPPAWLRPFHVLSNGEQFRVTLARTLIEQKGRIAAVDEFTSVVDRTVAQIGSAAVGKTVRARGQRFVAVTCHYDVEDWLQPDWVYEPHVERFRWRELQRRPLIELVVRRVGVEAWHAFRRHHYLNTEIHHAARAFLFTWHDRPVAFVAVLPNMGHSGQWREHRVVCLPDFQGVGIGLRASETVGSIVRGAVPDGEYRSVTSHPGFIASRKRSTRWAMTTMPSMGSGGAITAARRTGQSSNWSQSAKAFAVKRRGPSPPRWRLAASFVYVGSGMDADAARRLWGEVLP